MAARKNAENITAMERTAYYDLVHFTNSIKLEELVELVYNATGWTKDNTYTRSRAEGLVGRRGIIDLIAICNGIKIMDISRQTNRDHSTVIWSLKSIECRLDTDMHTRNLLREIMLSIKEGRE